MGRFNQSKNGGFFAGVGGVGIGAIQYFETDPGAGWLKCDGRAYTPISAPGLYGKIPAYLPLPTQVNSIPNRGSPTCVLIDPVSPARLIVAFSTQIFTYDFVGGADVGGVSFASAITRMRIANGLYFTLNGNAQIYTSSTGNNSSWSQVNLPQTGAPYDIAYGNGIYVAVGAAGSVWTSTTAANGSWVSRSSGLTADLNGVCFANGLFVAVGATGSPTAVITTSPDGITWTTRVTVGGLLYGVAYGNGRFVTTGGLSSGATINFTSTDGISWTPRGASIVGQGYRSIRFKNGLFLVSKGSQYCTSPDGQNWKVVSSEINSFNVSYGVIDADIADDGTLALAMWSANNNNGLIYKGSVLSLPIIDTGLTATGKALLPYMKAA